MQSDRTGFNLGSTTHQMCDPVLHNKEFVCSLSTVPGRKPLNSWNFPSYSNVCDTHRGPGSLWQGIIMVGPWIGMLARWVRMRISRKTNHVTSHLIGVGPPDLLGTRFLSLQRGKVAWIVSSILWPTIQSFTPI